MSIQAAKQRDSITQLELQKRQLEFEADQEARKKIVHDIGLQHGGETQLRQAALLWCRKGAHIFCMTHGSAGQVIRHKRYEYRGVIVGYDAVCSADEAWIQVTSKFATPTHPPHH